MDLEYVIGGIDELLNVMAEVDIGALALVAKSYYQMMIGRFGSIMTYIYILKHHFLNSTYKTIYKRIVKDNINTPLNILAGYQYRLRKTEEFVSSIFYRPTHKMICAN